MIIKIFFNCTFLSRELYIKYVRVDNIIINVIKKKKKEITPLDDKTT